MFLKYKNKKIDNIARIYEFIFLSGKFIFILNTISGY